MASFEKWEVVSKGKKGEPQKMSPQRRNELIENMPKLTIQDPIELDSTLYSAFLPKERPQQPSAKEDISKQNGSKKTTSNKNKKKDDRKPKPVDIENALSELDAKEMKTVLEKTKSLFPNHEIIWLKDLASYLNNKLENVKDTDPVYADRSSGFPMEAVPSPMAKDLRNFMKQFSKETLDSIFLFAVKAMLQESKSVPVHGYKLFLQLISQTKADAGLDSVPQFQELLKTHQNNPSKCLSILWALGQCGNKHFHYGLRVWFELMLPTLEFRQVAHYPVEYLENLFKRYKNLPKKSYGLVSFDEYFQVLDVFFGPRFTLASDLKTRLIVVHPIIKTLAYGDEPSQNLRNFFPSYLTRYANAKSKEMKAELLDSMTECLIVDKHSFGVWCQLYTQHLPTSGHLLTHINKNWSRLSSRFDKKVLRENLRSFSVTNEELETQTKGKQDGLKLSQAATKDLMTKLSGAHFPWSFLVFFFVSIFAAIVVYDITSSPTFRSSKTMRFLEHYGILALLEKTYKGVCHTTNLSITWLKKNFPIFYNQVRETVVPFSITVWSSSKEFLTNAEIHSRPYRELAVEKVIQLYYWVYNLSPEFWTRCEELTWLSWDMLKDYTFRLWVQLQYFAGEANHWLTEHVLTGSLSREAIKDTALWGVEHLQNCTSHLVSWTKEFFCCYF